MRKCFLALLFCISACAPKIVPVPTVTIPKFPDFTQPPVPPAFANSPVADTFSRGWAYLQAGDLKTAQREFGNALAAAPAFHPAETSLGYVELAQKDPKAALPHFDRALEIERNDLPALLGRGQACSLQSYRSSLVVCPFWTKPQLIVVGSNNLARAVIRDNGGVREYGVLMTFTLKAFPKFGLDLNFDPAGAGETP